MHPLCVFAALRAKMESHFDRAKAQRRKDLKSLRFSPRESPARDSVSWIERGLASLQVGFSLPDNHQRCLKAPHIAWFGEEFSTSPTPKPVWRLKTPSTGEPCGSKKKGTGRVNGQRPKL